MGEFEGYDVLDDVVEGGRVDCGADWSTDWNEPTELASTPGLDFWQPAAPVSDCCCTLGAQGDSQGTNGWVTFAEPGGEPMDLLAVDGDGDGLAELIIFDLDQDGIADAWALDTTGDGLADVLLIDTTGDGVPDSVSNWTPGEGWTPGTPEQGADQFGPLVPGVVAQSEQQPVWEGPVDEVAAQMSTAPPATPSTEATDSAPTSPPSEATDTAPTSPPSEATDTAPTSPPSEATDTAAISPPSQATTSVYEQAPVTTDEGTTSALAPLGPGVDLSGDSQDDDNGYDSATRDSDSDGTRDRFDAQPTQRYADSSLDSDNDGAADRFDSEPTRPYTDSSLDSDNDTTADRFDSSPTYDDR